MSVYGTNSLIASACKPLEEFKSDPLYAKLIDMDYVEKETDPEDVYVVVASIIDKPLVCAMGYASKHDKTFRLEFIIPLQDVIPVMDFGGLMLKHFPGFSVHYSPSASMDPIYIDFMKQVGMQIAGNTYVSGDSPCPEPTEGSVSRLTDLDFLAQERVKMILRFQSVYPENAPETQQYYASIDEMFDTAETFENVAVVGLRDGKPAGFAVIEQTADEDRTYCLAFQCVFSGFDGPTVLADMVNMLTYNMERLGCSMMVNVNQKTCITEEAMLAMGYVQHTINFFRR